MVVERCKTGLGNGQRGKWNARPNKRGEENDFKQKNK